MTLLRTPTVVVLGALTGLSALCSAATYPKTSTSVYIERDGVTTLVDVTHDPWGYALLAVLILAVACAVCAVVFFLRARDRAATGWFIAAAVFGIFAIVPGLLALLSIRAMRLRDA